MLSKKLVWRLRNILERFTSMVCSHPMCYCSMSSETTVSQLDSTTLIRSPLEIGNMVMNLAIVLDVDCFNQLETLSIYFLFTAFNMECY